ncbi:hypothetical protein AB834_01440 [PVC group bacterium (ex Bugula neritina AB1)]|nr:hypothetical protein AB834_01440 [PVC group bacterium (ex Bugula neritina AB1)]
MKLLQNLRKKWQLSYFDFFAVLLTFALTGMSVVWLKKPILDTVLPMGSPSWVKVIAYLSLILPLYQALLILYGTLLGQFSFFWEKEKKFLRFFFRWYKK